MFKT
jgi:hypothetical protein